MSPAELEKHQLYKHTYAFFHPLNHQVPSLFRAFSVDGDLSAVGRFPLLVPSSLERIPLNVSDQKICAATFPLCLDPVLPPVTFFSLCLSAGT